MKTETPTQSRPLVEMGKQYTSNGQPVRILCTDRPGRSGSAVVVVTAIGIIRCHHPDGRWDHTGDSAYDLVEVKPRIKRTVWVNVYENKSASGLWYLSREDAVSAAGGGRVFACVPLEIDVEEGEGL